VKTGIAVRDATGVGADQEAPPVDGGDEVT
jgi:hypothetical protein